MTNKGMHNSRRVRDTMKIMDNRKLPYTYGEVVELIQQLDGNMQDIEVFVNDYEKHLMTM